MEIMDLLRLIQFILSIVSALFVFSIVLAKLVNYLKVRYIEKKDLRDKKIEEKEKALFLELQKKYASKTLNELKEIKKDER